MSVEGDVDWFGDLDRMTLLMTSISNSLMLYFLSVIRRWFRFVSKRFYIGILG